MKSAPLPGDESARLEALAQYHVLDTPPEQAFDDLVQLAARICETPIALISLIDDRRQWFKAKEGIDATETPRDIAFCAHAILDKTQAFIVQDAAQDERFHDNPLVTSPPAIRFYAGVPLVTQNGHALGTLCVIDRKPRQLTPSQESALRVLAQHVMALLEGRVQQDHLKRSDQRLSFLELLVEQTHEPIWMLNPSAGFRVQYVNQATCRHLGYLESELHTMSVPDWDPDFSIARCEQLWQQLKYLKTATFETRHRRKTGQIVPVEVTANYVCIVGTEYCAGTIRDISERRRLEEQVRQAQKLESIGRLAGGIAHDFNNLLTATLGYSDLLLRQLPPDQTLHRYAQQIKKSGERAIALTQQILAFSRRQPTQAILLDLNSLVTGIEDLLHRLIGETVRLQFLPTQGLGPVRADPGQIEQVLMNLVLNARDAMPAGGQVTVETILRNLDEALPGTHEKATPGSYVVLSVSDEGQGMDEETRAHIFDPFFTTKSPGKGTGLGLSIVYGIVAEHGGFVEVQSQHGAGSRFDVWLPLAEATAAAEVVPSATCCPLPGGTETILLVEDEESVRSLVRNMLTEAGYRILEAADGEEALTLVKACRDPIHLLLTDVGMPHLRGPDLAAKLADLYPNLPVLYITGYASDPVREIQSIQNPTVLKKPFSQERLLRLVRDRLDQIPSS